MPSSPDVVFALTGDVRSNSRAIKQLRTVAALGVATEVMTLGATGEEVAWEPGIRLRVLPRPPGGGPRFFRNVHRVFSEAVQDLPARVYHASDLYSLPAMHAAAQQYGGRLVYDARELYPNVASTAGRPWVRLFWRRLEGRYVREADAVFTVSESIAQALADRYGIPHPDVLYNVPVRRDASPSAYLREQIGADASTPILLHQGSIQKDRGCFLLADAMRDVHHARLVFLGGGPLRPALERQVVDTHLRERIHFLDPVSPDDLLPVTASADAGITLLEDTCLNHRFALPNKLFEYLMAGLPVLASDLPEIRRVVTEFDVGLIVDPTDRQALVASLHRMAADTASRSRWAANAPRTLETFSWEKASHRLRQVYERLLSS